MDLELIKTLAERQRIPFKQVAATIGMSEGNLHRCVRENKIQAQDLEQIAKVLKVHIGAFFDEDGALHVEAHDNGMAAGRDILNGADSAVVVRLKAKVELLQGRIADKDEKIGDLQKRLEDKDATIAEKERTIQILLGNLK